MHRNHERSQRNTFSHQLPVHHRLDSLTTGQHFGYSLASSISWATTQAAVTAVHPRDYGRATRIASHMWSIGFLLNDLGRVFFTGPVRD